MAFDDPSLFSRVFNMKSETNFCFLFLYSAFSFETNAQWKRSLPGIKAAKQNTVYFNIEPKKKGKSTRIGTRCRHSVNEVKNLFSLRLEQLKFHRV